MYETDGSLGDLEGVIPDPNLNIGDVILTDRGDYLTLGDIWSKEDSGDYNDICLIFHKSTPYDVLMFKRSENLNLLGIE